MNATKAHLFWQRKNWLKPFRHVDASFRINGCLAGCVTSQSVQGAKIRPSSRECNFQGISYMQKRLLHLHEYQSLKIMSQYGISVPRGDVATTPEEAEAVAMGMYSANNSGFSDCECDFVVKAQVLAGGRGLGKFKENGFEGGVHICSSPSEVRDVASQMLKKTLITKQTGSEGKPCSKVLIAERFYVRREKYVALLMDRAAGGAVLVGSSRGGTSIEDIAQKYPDSIVKIPLPMPAEGTNPKDSINEALIREFCEELGFLGDNLNSAAQIIRGLCVMFFEKDCLLVEVNPLVQTNDGRVLVCDAKVNFDDNALFKNKDIAAQRDTTQEDQREVRASELDLNYIGLEGNIGCMVNGAGLAMATLDILSLYGGKPANFLDVGGGADEGQIQGALEILRDDSSVDVVFINIFGGILRCDILAKALVNAVRKAGLKKPVVIRLAGTNKEAAEAVINETKKENPELQILQNNDFDSATRMAVKVAQVVGLSKQAGMSVKINL